jgi:sugar phosphate isomerase/epimerase
VFVACSTLCFARYPLERALRMIGELEFSKLDVAIHENGPHLKPSQVAADVAQAAQQIRIGPSLTPAAFDVQIEAAGAKETLVQWKAICKLARMSTVSVLSISAAAAGVGMDAEVRRLGQLVRLVDSEGLVLTVATRIGTLTEQPAAAVELCQRVPGLGLTLDPSHYVNGPHQGDSYDELFPHVKHVHLRDTGRAAGKFQVRIGQGEIEYGRIINQLERQGYDRLLSVAIQDKGDGSSGMEAEVRKLKFLLESLV